MWEVNSVRLESLCSNPQKRGCFSWAKMTNSSVTVSFPDDYKCLHLPYQMLAYYIADWPEGQAGKTNTSSSICCSEELQLGFNFVTCGSVCKCFPINLFASRERILFHILNVNTAALLEFNLQWDYSSSRDPMWSSRASILWHIGHPSLPPPKFFWAVLGFTV